jgi:HAD superfamily hydrolase (TIGR01509 family)
LGGAEQRGDGDRPFRIAAVVFDFDGTLTKPGAIDFRAIHEAVGCPEGVGLLEFLDAVDDHETRLHKESVLIEAEMKAAAGCEANPGVTELLAEIRRAQIPMAVITRNRREAVERAMLNLDGVDRDDFACLVTRDLPLSPKPAPEAVVHVAHEMGVQVEEMLLVGDHAYDIEAGARAGAMTMFLTNGKREGGERERVQSDFVVADLSEALEIISRGLCLPAQ